MSVLSLLSLHIYKIWKCWENFAGMLFEYKTAKSLRHVLYNVLPLAITTRRTHGLLAKVEIICSHNSNKTSNNNDFSRFKKCENYTYFFAGKKQWHAIYSYVVSIVNTH
jgi:hypothetical protein